MGTPSRRSTASMPTAPGDSCASKWTMDSVRWVAAAAPARCSPAAAAAARALRAAAGRAGLRNIVGTLPGRRPGIVVGAHYDTLVKPKGFVGANNGAAGTAVVIEVARALAKARPADGAQEVRFVLFDGEEPAAGAARGERQLLPRGAAGLARLRRGAPRQDRGMVLLDYVGNKKLRLPREGSSTIALWTRLRAAARKVGAQRVFPAEVGEIITDDHTPFLRAGVPPST